MTEDQKQVRLLLRKAARDVGMDPDILDAIGYVESRWRAGAENTEGPDGARGGAWGPTQITMRTAQEVGYTGDEAGLQDPETAAEVSGQIMASRPGGVPYNIEDACAWWNAGIESASGLPTNGPTLLQYIPAAHRALDLVRQDPVDEEC